MRAFWSVKYVRRGRVKMMDVRPVYSLSRLTDRSLLNLTKFLELELSTA